MKKKRNDEMTSLEKTKQVVKILDQKKAENIKVLKIDNITVMTDYFVIASSDNSTHVKALVEEVEFKMKEQGVTPLRSEGHQSASWVILDYGDVIVHIFHEEAREYYDLDKLWAAGEEIALEDLIG